MSSGTYILYQGVYKTRGAGCWVVSPRNQDEDIGVAGGPDGSDAPGSGQGKHFTQKGPSYAENPGT